MIEVKCGKWGETVSRQEDLKNDILLYLRTHYERHKSVPSVRAILRQFKRTGLTSTLFYDFYSEGLPQVCREAGVPPPERLRRTRAATKARTDRTSHEDKSPMGETTSPGRVQLSAEMTRRLLGVSYLEGGKDPNVVLGELFDRDSTVRKLTQRPEHVATVVGFVEKALEWKWEMNGLIDAVTRSWNAGLLNIDPASAKRVIDFVENLRSRQWDIVTFVDYATKHSKGIDLQARYMRGEISLQDLELRLANA